MQTAAASHKRAALPADCMSGTSQKQMKAPKAKAMLRSEMAFGVMPEAQAMRANVRAQAVLRDFSSRRGPTGFGVSIRCQVKWWAETCLNAVCT